MGFSLAQPISELASSEAEMVPKNSRRRITFASIDVNAASVIGNAREISNLIW